MRSKITNKEKDKITDESSDPNILNEEKPMEIPERFKKKEESIVESNGLDADDGNKQQMAKRKYLMAQIKKANTENI